MAKLPVNGLKTPMNIYYFFIFGCEFYIKMQEVGIRLQ
jgi:hypothetical protein